jgi:hypothetical protein
MVQTRGTMAPMWQAHLQVRVKPDELGFRVWVLGLSLWGKGVASGHPHFLSSAGPEYALNGLHGQAGEPHAAANC